MEAATRLPFAEGCDRETALFLQAVRTEPAKALIHVFFAERAVKWEQDVVVSRTMAYNHYFGKGAAAAPAKKA